MNVGDAKLLTTLYLLPCFLCLWPAVWWIEILAILPVAFAQKRYNEQNNAAPALVFAPRATASLLIGVILTFGLVKSGFMTQSYNFHTAETPTSQAQGQSGNIPGKQPTSEEQEKPVGNQETPVQGETSEDKPLESAANPTPTPVTAKAAAGQPTASVSTPKAAIPQPASPKIIYAKLSVSTPVITIKRSLAVQQAFTISAADGSKFSYPHTLGLKIMFVSSVQYPNKLNNAYTMTAQPGSMPNGTHSVDFEAVHSENGTTWRYSGSVLVHITD